MDVKNVGVSSLCLVLAGLLANTTPSWAQFEEPDTVPRFSIGGFVDLNLRGNRGDASNGNVKVSFSNGATFGARLDYRVTRSLGLGVRASYGRSEEKQQREATTGFSEGSFTHLMFAGELLLRVKPSVPGYFVLGGGVRYVDPGADASDESADQFTQFDSFTEPFGLLGVGLEFASTRRRAVRIDFRTYLVSPANEPRINTNSLEVDFALGLSFLYRP